MRQVSFALGWLALAALVVPAAQAPPAADWAGTWVGSVDTGMGVDTITIILKKDGSTFAGTVNDTLGFVEKDTTISEVKPAGPEISFSFKALGGSIDLAMKLSVEAGKISGQMMNKAIGEWGPFQSLIKK